MCENGIQYWFSPFLNSSLKKDFSEYEYDINLNAMTVLTNACSIFFLLFLLKQKQKKLSFFNIQPG